MEVSDATEALLQKLRLEQRKLQQTIHFPGGVDSRLAATPSEENLFNNNNNRRRDPHDDENFKRQQQKEESRERRFRKKSEEHLLLEIEALHDRIRNLESALQYERERHQQTRELLRVALKPPPEEQERIHQSYQRDHSGAFIADGPNIRGDDMASILVGAASPMSRSMIDLQEVQQQQQQQRSNNNKRRSQTPTAAASPENNNNNNNGSSSFRHYGNGSINNDGIRLAPFPAQGQSLGAASPNVMPARCERYEVYGNKVSSSRAAQLIYEKAHQMEHSPRASRAVLADFKANQQQFTCASYRQQDNPDDDEDHELPTSGTIMNHVEQRSRHMTPTPARPKYMTNSNSTTPLQSSLHHNANSAAKPFGIGEKRFTPVSIFGEQQLHRSMYEEGTPRSQVRPSSQNINHNQQQQMTIRRGNNSTPMRVGGNNNNISSSSAGTTRNSTPRRTMTPTVQVMTLRSPAARY